jgi:hypothetical protein
MTESLKEQFLKLKTEIGGLVEQVDTNKNTHLQNYIFFVFFPLFSYAESIIILCENGKNHSAKVLLRTLFEIHINVIYFQTGDSERKLAQTTKSGFDSKIKGLKEIKALIKKYPNLESQDPTNLWSNAWLDAGEEWAEKQRKGILRANNLKETDQDLDLKSKTVKCDDAAIDSAEPGHFGRMYSVIYRLLSPPSHLNIEGLQTFVNQDDTGKYVFDDGDDGDFLIAEAISICVAFTKDLYDLEVLSGKQPIVLKQLEDRVKDK